MKITAVNDALVELLSRREADTTESQTSNKAYLFVRSFIHSIDQ